MRTELETPDTTKTWWARTAINVVRLVLLAILVWALFSEYFPGETPIAGDPATTTKSSRSTAEP